MRRKIPEKKGSYSQWQSSHLDLCCTSQWLIYTVLTTGSLPFSTGNEKSHCQATSPISQGLAAFWFIPRFSSTFSLVQINILFCSKYQADHPKGPSSQILTRWVPACAFQLWEWAELLWRWSSGWPWRGHIYGFPGAGLKPWLDLSHFRVGSDTLKSGLFSSQAVNSALEDASQHLFFLIVQPVPFAQMNGKSMRGLHFLSSLPAQPRQKADSESWVPSPPL